MSSLGEGGGSFMKWNIAHLTLWSEEFLAKHHSLVKYKKICTGMVQ